MMQLIHFQQSYEQIDIGAFPMLPGQNQKWLVEFLKEIIGEDSSTKIIREESPTYFTQSIDIKKRNSTKILPKGIYSKKYLI